MGLLKFLRGVIPSLTFTDLLCSRNPHLAPLVQYAKKKGIALENPPEDSGTRSRLRWDSGKKQRKIIIPVDESGRIIPNEPSWKPLFLLAYYIERLDVERLKLGVCRPINPALVPFSSSLERESKYERERNERQWEKALFCYLEEKLAFSRGVEIIRSLNLFDFSDIKKGVGITEWALNYLSGECDACKFVIRSDTCPLLTKDYEVRPQIKRDILDRANKIFDSLAGREDSWRDVI